MERSRMHYVPTTFDKEKRRSFKDKLAERAFSEPEAEPVKEFNDDFLVPEKQVFHPDLGLGTVISSDYHEVTVDFNGRVVTLVISKARSFLSSDLPDYMKEKKDDCFIGETISRSSLPPVNEEAENEKRSAFKQKLAVKAFSEPEVVDSWESKLPFKVGMRVSHPALGQGEVVSINPREVEINFDSQGSTVLVLNKAQSFLSPVTSTQELSSKEDCFIGDEIDRSPLNRPDQVFIQRDSLPLPETTEVSKVVLSEGDTVWHPSFGASEIVSIDRKQNLAVLRVGGKDLEVVFSRIISSVKKIEGKSPDHVGFNQRVEEPETVESSVEDQILRVSLPTIFKTFKPYNQYLYLTKELKLTPEEASDTIEVFNGKSSFYKNIEISWDE